MNFVAAILYAVSTSSLVALLLAFARGGLSPAIAALALGCGLLVMSLSLWQGRHDSRPERSPSLPEWLAIMAFALVSLRIFLWVVFVNGDQVEVLSPNNLGDLSLHLTYVRYLASGVSFWPDNPIFTGGKLTYPIGIDLFHSLLALVGMNVLRGFIWMGVIGAALTGAALWRWGRGFVLFGFLANGGLAGFAIFSFLATLKIDLHHGGVFFQQAPGLADFQTELAWKSFALALFATQRGLLFALPAGLLLLSSWRTRFFGGSATGWRLPIWGEWLLYSSMPLFHFHTFLFLSVLLGVWFVAQILMMLWAWIVAQLSMPSAPPERPAFQKTALRDLLLLVGLAVAPATALVMLITGGLKGGRMLGWKAGWMWDDETFLDWCATHLGNRSLPVAASAFWPVNFGLWPLAVLLLVVVLCRRDKSPVVENALEGTPPSEPGDGSRSTDGGSPIDPPPLVPDSAASAVPSNPNSETPSERCRRSWARLVVFPALGIFVICCFVKFAPWEWDNTKLMIWCYLAILPFLWSELLARARVLERCFVVGMLFFSGFVSTLGGINATFTGYPIATRSELDAVAHAVRGIPVTERFAGAPTYNHPLLLNGRKMVLGYIGHVHSHGLAWEEPSKKLDALMNGEDGWQAIADELGARYLFWGREESEKYSESPQPWRQTTRRVALGDWGAIYDLRSPPESSPGLPSTKE